MYLDTEMFSNILFFRSFVSRNDNGDCITYFFACTPMATYFLISRFLPRGFRAVSLIIQVRTQKNHQSLSNPRCHSVQPGTHGAWYRSNKRGAHGTKPYYQEASGPGVNCIVTPLSSTFHLVHRAPAGQPITAHLSYAFSMAWEGWQCDGSPKQNTTKQCMPCFVALITLQHAVLALITLQQCFLDLKSTIITLSVPTTAYCLWLGGW